MIYITGDNASNEIINLTRGDDAVIEVPLRIDKSTEYEMDPNDYLIFCVRELPSPESPILLSINSQIGDNRITFAHEDTKDLEIGYYSAEIQLMTSDGKRITVWPELTGNSRTSKSNRKNFCLMTEVVYE